MKKYTTTILSVSKILALLGAIGFSIVCGGQLLTLVASYINLDWAKRTYLADLNLFRVRELSIWYFTFAMVINIAVAALKAFVWYVLFNLLLKLKLQTPFSIDVEKKLEGIAYLLFAIWLFNGFFWKTYLHYLLQDTGIQLPPNNNADEYLFMAGMVYIISQIFKRGIELQEENNLTV